MKRWLALAGAAAVIVLAATPVAADPAAPTAPPAASNGVPSDAVALSIQQVKTSGLAVTLDPGATEDHDLIVSNHTSDLRLTVKLTATDATGNLGAGAGSWVAFADDAVQLDPHAATDVPIKVTVPHDTQPGQALAHITATVVTAVAAADGSPRAGTAQASIPVAITISGTPTQQLAIADVHRVDQGKDHSLAIVLRNFSAQETAVTGHVRVTSAKPQEKRFDAKVPATQDLTVTVPWDAPPQNTPVDISVDAEYNGNVAAWSSTLGGPPVSLTPTSAATTSDANSNSSSDNSNAGNTIAPAASASGPSKPWWNSLVVPGVVLGIILAGMWFVLEMKRAKRREEQMPYPPYFMGPPGYGPAGSDAAGELAKQLVRLTEIIVSLTTEGAGGVSTPVRARSPGHDPPANAPPAEPFGPVAPVTTTARDRDPPPEADEDRTPFVVPLARAASPTPRDEPRPESDEESEPQEDVAPREEPAAEARPRLALDPTAGVMERLLELDAQRRRYRQYMDTEEVAEHFEPPRRWELDTQRQSLFDDEDDDTF